MYRGKRVQRRKKKGLQAKGILVCVFLLVCTAVGGTIAYIHTQTPSLTNIFLPTDVSTAVIVSDEGAYYVKNTGSTSAWIRAAVVVTWQDGEGNVYGRMPVADTDYSISFASADDSSDDYWLKSSDGYWYYKEPVEAEEAVTLIESVKYKANAPAGYDLYVEVLGSGLQSQPATVFAQCWTTTDVAVSDDGSKLVLNQGGD